MNGETNFLRDVVVIDERIADRIIIGDTPSNTNDFDDSVILHEIGHYMHWNFSKSSSPGGIHFIGQRLDPRLAFAEGWASFFAQAVIGHPLYIDSKNPSTFTFSVENFNTSTMASTYESENAVANVLWDLLDTADTSSDGEVLALDFSTLWEKGMVPLGAPEVRFVYLHSFLDQLKGAGVLTASEVTANFCDTVREAVCDPPFNDAYNPSSPVPFPRLVIGPNQTVDCGVNAICDVDAATGQFNLAVSNDYYRLDLPEAGTLTIDLTVDFPSLDDLELYLAEDEQGENLAFSLDPTGTERISRSLEAGTYMIQVLGHTTTSGAGPLIPYRLTTSFVP